MKLFGWLAVGIAFVIAALTIIGLCVVGPLVMVLPVLSGMWAQRYARRRNAMLR